MKQPNTISRNTVSYLGIYLEYTASVHNISYKVTLEFLENKLGLSKLGDFQPEEVKKILDDNFGTSGKLTMNNFSGM